MAAGTSSLKKPWCSNLRKLEMNGMNLKDKTPIATGGARGLGQAISHRLAREGCRVLIADVNETGVNATAAAIAKETGQRVLGMKVDVTHEANVKALFRS